MNVFTNYSSKNYFIIIYHYEFYFIRSKFYITFQKCRNRGYYSGYYRGLEFQTFLKEIKIQYKIYVYIGIMYT